MNWLKVIKKGFKFEKKEVKNVWTKCEKCGEILYNPTLEKNLWVCPKCGYHFRVNSNFYIKLLADEGTWEEFGANIESIDFLKFKDKKKYSDRLKTYKEKTGKNDAVTTGECKINSIPVILAVMDFSFMGGSMGSVVGEKIKRAIQRAIDKYIPLIIISASGGARMQESIMSLMQMAKTSAYLAKLSEKRLPFISILTHPTTGGVTASYASLGDVILAEPGALIGFAGPRVIKETIKQELPKGFQRSEFLLEHGFVDKIVDRHQLKDTVTKLLEYMYNR